MDDLIKDLVLSASSVIFAKVLDEMVEVIKNKISKK